MFRGYRTLRNLSVAAITVAILVSPAQVHAETYMTVSDAPVDVTAKNSAAARDQAIATAQSKAFDRLVKRLVPNAADQARVHPSQQDIESFVQDFGVENERVSSVRYIGLYSVRFRAGRVQKYLADAKRLRPADGSASTGGAVPSGLDFALIYVLAAGVLAALHLGKPGEVRH